jgi:ribosomal protein L40E
MIPFLGFIFTVVGWLFYLAVLIPSIALGVRRLHDTNRGGLLFLLILIPLAGIIILIVFWVQEGTAGENKFGSDPKTGEGAGKKQANISSGEKSVFCGECGAKNEKGAKFCGSCGKALN